ncbi:MAG: lytic transglycosylase domain-containing protein [Nitrospinota bacterium]
MLSLLLICFAVYMFLLLTEFAFQKFGGVRRLWTGFRILVGIAGLTVLTGLAAEWTGIYPAGLIHRDSSRYLASSPNAWPANRSLDPGTLLFRPGPPGSGTSPQGLVSPSLIEQYPDIYRYIRHYSSLYRVDPLLVQAVIKVESAFDPMAVSHKGAKGLMQINEITAKHLGVKNPFNIRENIEGGTRYLEMLLKKHYWNLHLALASYNAGPGTVERYKGIPPFRETRRYVWKVLGEYRRLKHLAEVFRENRLRAKRPGKQIIPTRPRALKPPRAQGQAAG